MAALGVLDVSATIRPMGVLRSRAWGSGDEEHPLLTVRDGQSLETACLEVGLRPDLIALFLVNGRPEPKEYVLRAGDDVKLVALVGGG